MNKFKKIINYMTMEFKKIFNSYSVYGMALVVVMLCFLIPIYNEDRSRTNYLYVFFMCNKEDILNSATYTADCIISNVTSGYFIMFAPMIVSLALIPIFCEEKESGLIRYLLPRSGFSAMTKGSFIASQLVGGIVLLMGYIIFFAIVIAHSVFIGEAEFMDLLSENWFEMINLCIGTFLYGVVCSSFTFLTSIFVKNRYLLASIPYMFLWIVDRFINNAGRETFFSKYLHISRFLSPFYVGKDLIVMFGFYLIFSILVVSLAKKVMQRSVDCGK